MNCNDIGRPFTGTLKILRDLGALRTFRAGDTISNHTHHIQTIEPPPGTGGWKGYYVREWTGTTVYAMTEDEDVKVLEQHPGK